MNTEYRKRLPGTDLDYFDTRAAVDAIQPGAYDTLPYTSRILAEQLVRRCEPAALTDALKQLIERKRDLDFPWYPARVVCHDILGQTALVDLAGLRDTIAEQGGASSSCSTNPTGTACSSGAARTAVGPPASSAASRRPTRTWSVLKRFPPITSSSAVLNAVESPVRSKMLFRIVMSEPSSQNTLFSWDALAPA